MIKLKNNINMQDRLMSIKQLMELSNEEYILIDIREKYKYKLGHIPNAVSMSENEIIKNIEELKRYNKVVVYCDYGNAGVKLVYKIFNDYDMNNIYNIVGGYNVYRGRIVRN